MASTRYIEGLAYEYMKEHGLIARGWKFGWNNRKTALGLCSYSKKTLYMSRLLAPSVSDEDARNTILHEIAHALTEGHGHNVVWRRKFIEIGGNGKTRTEAITRDVALSLQKYKVFCGGGKMLGTANKRTKRLTTATCRCHNKPLVFLPNV